MGILDDLFAKTTGMQNLLQTQKQSTDETSMDVNYNADQKFTDPYTRIKTKNPYFKDTSKVASWSINPETGDRDIPKDAYNDFGGSQTPQKETQTPAKENGIDTLGTSNPGFFKQIFGSTYESLAAKWEEKGGFDALMASPGFTVGMALMKSSAEGKRIGGGMLEAAVQGGAISKQYADKIKEKQGLLAPVSEEQMTSMRSVLEEQGISSPGVIDKMKNLFGGNAEAEYREALQMVYVEAERLAQSESKRLRKKIRFEPRKFGKQAVDNLKASKKLIVREDAFYRSGTIRAKTKKITGTRAEGGPIQANKNYIVGEKGPEMFVSEENGTIINNDDSKVVSMLLESNPQLKNVSSARAVKILKARFPDYF